MAQLDETEMIMRLPRINWIKLGENLAACDPYAAALMADASIQTHGGQMLVAQPRSATEDDRQERYEVYYRPAGRAVHPTPAAV
jgi:hypothetical protein